MFNFSKSTNAINRVSFFIFLVFLCFLAVWGILLLTPNYDAGSLFRVFFIYPFKDLAQIKKIVLYSSAFLTGSIAVIICYRIGFINLNVAGQMSLTGLTVYILAQNLKGIGLTKAQKLDGITSTDFNWMPILIVAGIAAAVLLSMFVATIKIYFGVSEILTGIFLNYIVQKFFRATVFYKSFVSDAGTDTAQGVGEAVGFNHIFLEVLSVGFIVTIAVYLLIGFVIFRTRFGFELNIIGNYPKAARYAGINVRKKIMKTFIISGLLSGIAGLFYYYRGFDDRLFANDSLPANGFDTLTIVWLAQISYLALPLVAVFIAWMRAQQGFVLSSEVDPQIIELLIGLILLVIAFFSQFYTDSTFLERLKNSIAFKKISKTEKFSKNLSVLETKSKKNTEWKTPERQKK